MLSFESLMQGGAEVNWSEIMTQTYELAEECVKTNYYGAKQVTEALPPLLELSESTRVVNISSTTRVLKVFWHPHHIHISPSKLPFIHFFYNRRKSCTQRVYRMPFYISIWTSVLIFLQIFCFEVKKILIFMHFVSAYNEWMG